MLIGDEDIAITVLGASGSGKTCYLLGMYATSVLGIEGLTILAENDADDILLNNRWNRLVSRTDSTRWPPGTPRNEPYLFSLNLGFTPFVRFSWLDYGGDLLNRDESDEEVHQLRETVRKSSCILLCISGEHFREPVRSINSSLSEIALTRRMHRIIADAAREPNRSPENPLPIVIVITQSDLCDERLRDSWDEVETEIRKIIFPLLFEPAANCLVAICPVSLGKGLANDRDHAPIEPVHIELPIAFAIYAKFREYGRKYRSDRQAAREDVARLEERNWFSRWRQRETIMKRRNEITALETNLEELDAKLRLLTRGLDQTPIYLRGEEYRDL